MFYFHCFLLLCVGVNGYTSHRVTKKRCGKSASKGLFINFKCNPPTSQQRYSALLAKGCMKFLATAGCSENLFHTKELGANERRFILPTGQTLSWESQDSLAWHFYSDYKICKWAFSSLSLSLGQLPSAGVKERGDVLPSHGARCLGVRTWWPPSLIFPWEHSWGSAPFPHLIFVAIGACYSSRLRVVFMWRPDAHGLHTSTMPWGMYWKAVLEVSQGYVNLL